MRIRWPEPSPYFSSANSHLHTRRIGTLFGVEKQRAELHVANGRSDAVWSKEWWWFFRFFQIMQFPASID